MNLQKSEDWADKSNRKSRGVADPFECSDTVEMPIGSRGILLIKGSNFLVNMAIECKSSDWFMFWGSRDPNLKHILSLSGDMIPDYAKQCSEAIMADTWLNDAYKKIYSRVYENYFEKMHTTIVCMSKDYEYIRVWYNKFPDRVL